MRLRSSGRFELRDHLARSGFGFKPLVREQDAAAAHEILHPVHKAPEGKLVLKSAECGIFPRHVFGPCFDLARNKRAGESTGAVWQDGQLNLRVR